MEAAAAGGAYEGPVISRIVEKDKRDKADPSNLPYLHKNPAIWKHYANSDTRATFKTNM